MDIETQKSMMVYKSQEINEAVCKLSNDAYKLVLLYVSMIRPDSDDPNGIKNIYLEDYCQITQENERTIRDKVYDLCKEIAENPLCFRNANGDFLIASWFASAEWKDDEKKIALKSNEKIQPFLFDLKKKLDAIYSDDPQTVEMEKNLSGRYIKYPYGRVANLKGKYSIRFYEILRPSKKIGSLKIDLDLLRQAIGAFKGRLAFSRSGDLTEAPNYIYPNFGGFHKHILKPSIEELSEKTDMLIECKPLKKGKKVISLKFDIKDNPNAESFAHQPSLFGDFDNCPPPAEPPQDLEQPIELPQAIIDKIPAGKYTGRNGCKALLESILKKYGDHGQEAVEFYVDYVLASKKDVPNWGGYIATLEKNGVYTSQAEANRQAKKEGETAAQRFLELYRTCEEQTLIDAYRAGNEYAIAVWREGRGAEIEERRTEEKRNQEEEFAHKDQIIKELLETDFDNFIEFANSKAFRSGTEKNFQAWIDAYPNTHEISLTAKTTLRKALSPYLEQKQKVLASPNSDMYKGFTALLEGMEKLFAEQASKDPKQNEFLQKFKEFTKQNFLTKE